MWKSFFSYVIYTVWWIKIMSCRSHIYPYTFYFGVAILSSPIYQMFLLDLFFAILHFIFQFEYQLSWFIMPTSLCFSISKHGMKAIRWKHIACALGIAVNKPHLKTEIWHNTFGSMKKHLALKWEIGYESLCTNTKCLGIFCPCQTIIFLSSVYLQLMIEFQPPKNPISALCMYPQYTQLLPVHTAACTAKLISSL